MGNVEPKPKDDLPHPCYKCSQMTTNWYSEYPKSMEIKYKCLTCKDAEKEEQKKLWKAMNKQMDYYRAQGKDPLTGL